MNRQIGGVLELTVSSTLRSQSATEFSFAIENLNAMIVEFGDIHIPNYIDRQAGRGLELP